MAHEQAQPQLNEEQQQTFRGIIIPIEGTKFGVQFNGGVTFYEAYGVLKLVVEQLEKDIESGRRG